LPTPEEVEVAELLLAKAASDLSAARALARDLDQQDDVVGFHAQQAVEKALKAVLAVRGFEIPRTHDLDLLTRLVVRGSADIPGRHLVKARVRADLDEPFEIVSNCYAGSRMCDEAVAHS
jgi:HEPN domain-containing protein